MLNLIMYYEHMYAYKDIFLTVFSFFSIICGILVLVSKNPIISILFLIGLFLSISIYLLLAGISFIGISYLVVYIGAVSILFLFILMLINIRTSELVSNT
jgi:NADH-ubiquinone oxidoreductase chain 6